MWVELTSSTGATIRLYQLYRCIAHPRLESSVFQQQQQNYFLSRGDNRDPCSALLEDLANEIQQYEGQKTVVMGDFNENISSNAIQEWSGMLGLQEATSASIGKNKGTHCSNQHDCQINGIFSDLPLSSAGITDFGIFNHRTLWMNLSLTTAFGFHYQSPHPLPTQQLYLHKVQAVDWYHASLSDAIF